jgi:large-conductance mechanosensitive channel
MNTVGDSSNSGDIRFNFIRFIVFLKNNNILSTAIAAVLSDRVNDLTNTIIDYAIMPIINRDADNDGISDIKNLEDKKFNVFGVNLGVGKCCVSIIKFVLITYVIFVISNIIDFKKFDKLK